MKAFPGKWPKGAMCISAVFVLTLHCNVYRALSQGLFCAPKGRFTVWATEKTVAQTVFSVAQIVFSVTETVISVAQAPPSARRPPLNLPKLFPSERVGIENACAQREPNFAVATCPLKRGLSWRARLGETSIKLSWRQCAKRMYNSTCLLPGNSMLIANLGNLSLPILGIPYSFGQRTIGIHRRLPVRQAG